MKKPTIFNYLYVFILLSIFGCETEDFEIEKELTINTPVDNVQTSTEFVSEIKSEDIPEIVQSIQDAMGGVNLISKSISYKKSVVDMNTILKVKTSNNNMTNYTFPVYVTGQTNNEFFNLIVSKDKKGRVSKPYVRHYMVNPIYLKEYLESDYDFAHFKGTYYKYRFNDFFNALDSGKGLSTLKGAGCDDEGTTVGNSGTGDPYVNPDLIQIDATNQWGASNYAGYLSFPSWSAGQSAGSYSTNAYVNDNTRGVNEYASVDATYGIVQVSAVRDITTFNLGQALAINVTTTHAAGGTFFLNSSGSKCSIKITISIKHIGGRSIIVTTYEGCDDAPMNKTGKLVTTAKGDCPDGSGEGEVAVFNRTTVNNIKNKLGLSYSTPAFDWISSNHAEADQLNNFIVANTVNGVLDEDAKQFANEVLSDFINEINISDIFEEFGNKTFLNDLLNSPSFISTKNILKTATLASNNNKEKLYAGSVSNNSINYSFVGESLNNGAEVVVMNNITAPITSLFHNHYNKAATGSDSDGRLLTTFSPADVLNFFSLTNADLMQDLDTFNLLLVTPEQELHAIMIADQSVFNNILSTMQQGNFQANLDVYDFIISSNYNDNSNPINPNISSDLAAKRLYEILIQYGLVVYKYNSNKNKWVRP